MTGTMNPQDLMGMDVYDSNGEKIGKVGTVYVSDTSKNPQWITVKNGFFGHKESLAPLAGAQFNEGGLRINASKETVRDAPSMGDGEHLSEQDGMRLYQHYGMTDGAAGAKQNANQRDGMLPRQDRMTEDAAMPGRDMADWKESEQDTDPQTAGITMPTGTAGTTGADPRAAADARHRATERDTTARDAAAQETAAPEGTGRGRDDSMIRSEERLSVDTETVETGRARLRKYVVTEEQQMSVPVSHEEVRLEREPITDGTANSGAGIGEDAQEVVLHEERPVVHKETVPVERVRLNTETVTEEQTVAGEVRKEQIEMNDPSNEKGRGKSR